MLNRVLGLLFRSERIRRRFISESVRRTTLTHLQSAVTTVKVGFTVALFADILITQRALKIPILSKAVTGTNSIIAMHNESVSYSNIGTHNDGNSKCTFDGNITNWDEIIVGSGPGGSVAAYYSIKSGRKTLLIEAGGHQREDISHHSTEQLMESFSYGGQEIILGPDIIPFAQGKVVGGGSEVNSGLYHRLPFNIKSEWMKSLLISQEEWELEETFVEQMLKIERQDHKSIGLYKDSPLLLAAQTQGWHCEIIPRWRTYSNDKIIHHGMDSTFLHQAKANDLVLLTNHSAKRIVANANTVTIEVVGINCKHIFESKSATLAAGTIETPKLLLKSRLVKANQTQMNFHAMSRLVAEYDHQVNDLQDIDPHQAWPNDYSAKFGAAVGTHELLAATLTNLGITEKLKHSNLGVYYASTVPFGKSGFLRSPIGNTPFFFMNQSTKNRITENTQALHRGLVASGAKRIFGSLESPQVSTVHVFGSLPLIDSSVVDKSGYVSGTNNLVRVCDASLLPSAPVVNPQGPVMHLCGLLSRKIYS